MCKPTRTRKPLAPVAVCARWVSVSRFTFSCGASARLDLNGTTYSVLAHQEGGRVLGWRLTKEDGTTYDVCLDGPHPSCECLGFLRWGRCKHVAGLPAALAQLAPVAA